MRGFLLNALGLESISNISRLIFIVFTIIIGGGVTSASAQSFRDSTSSHSFRISYPVNETELYEDYQDNEAALEMIRYHFQHSPRIDSIVIYSYASPEGPYKLNKRLAEERGKRARRFLLEQFPAERNFPDSLIIIKPTAENWDGLYEMVYKFYPYKDKEDVLELLTRPGLTQDQRKVMLKKLNGGIPWGFIRSKILPQLRYATWVAEWVHISPIGANIPAIRPQLIARQSMPSLSVPKPEIQHTPEAEGKKLILALKSNLLYDLVSFTNFSIEVPIYKDKLSLLYYHQFPWWTWGQADNEYCSRFLSIGGEARWWFMTKDRLNGHFLGAYAESGKYDFEYQRSICYQGEFYSAGLSYGYAMPIGRNLNLEFSISAGYASIAYRGYTPSEDYEILWRDPEKVGRLHYFGPTKAQVSLVIPIRVKTKGGNVL